MTIEEFAKEVRESLTEIWKAISKINIDIAEIKKELTNPDPAHCVQRDHMKKQEEEMHELRIKVQEHENVVIIAKTTLRVVGILFSAQTIGGAILLWKLLETLSKLAN
jgi:hypothetical protein